MSLEIPPIKLNTKLLFGSLCKALKVDCVCDIGSRDGLQSLYFRDILPEATIVAFEANPINFKAMQKDRRLQAAGLQIYSVAVSDQKGKSHFHITDVDYENPHENTGTSSLLIHEGLKIKDSIEVETVRIDEFIHERYPECQKIALWLDVEGAEYSVLIGASGIKDRIVAIHAEVALKPMRIGQKTYNEDVKPLLEGFGFEFCGTNIPDNDVWGDVVFIQKKVAENLGSDLEKCKKKAMVGNRLKVDFIAYYLQRYCRPLYSVARKLYLKLAS
ncbi:MAG: FkbM family methyltransferase [Verrucomicrobiota bacterium]|nr:FkbM family methyltransferase [Verrucomicrobiota bacterium]